MHLEVRLDLAVYEKLVTQDAIQVEQIEEEQPRLRIEDLVGKQHRDVAVAARQSEADRLVAAVVIAIEHQEEAGEPLLDVL